MGTRHSEWIENWYREAERLFNDLPSVPPELEGEIQKLLLWKAQTRQVFNDYWHAKEQLWLRRMERADARARIDAIVERQRIATEMEIEERWLRRWRRELERLKAEIDRICDKIIREMRRRHAQARTEAAQQDEAERRKREDDLRVWEAFKIQLAVPARIDAVSCQEEQADQEHLRREYEAFHARAGATDEENQAAWEAYIAEFSAQRDPNEQD